MSDFGKPVGPLEGLAKYQAQPDWTDYLQTSMVKPLVQEGKAEPFGYTDTNAMGTVISEIVRNKFPDFTRGLSTKMTAQDPPFPAYASYRPWGDTIQMGQIDGSATWKPGDYKGGLWGNYFPTDRVIDKLGTTLHELYHAKDARRNPDLDMATAMGPDWQQMMQDADKANFPSVGHNSDNSFPKSDIHEFLATAHAIDQMREKDIEPRGRYAPLAKAYDEMLVKYPSLRATMLATRDPDRPTRQMPEEPGVLYKIQQYLQGANK